MTPEGIGAKLRRLADRVAADRGPFDLVALFLRDEAELWDLVVSAPWLPAGDRASYEYVAVRVREVLDPDEFAALSRIVILDSGGAVAASYLEQFAGREGEAEVGFVTGGLVIRRGWVVVAARPGQTTEPSPRGSGVGSPAGRR